MSLWSWLFSKRQTQVPWLERSGHRLHWAPRDRPVNVYLDVSLCDGWARDVAQSVAFAVVRELRQLGAPLLMPVTPERETLVRFAASRATVFQSILIQPVQMDVGPGQVMRCTCDYRDDDRTGELRSCLIDWRVTGNYAQDRATLVHELCHSIGLGHQDGTVMAERRNISGGPLDLSDAHVEAIRREYR